MSYTTELLRATDDAQTLVAVAHLAGTSSLTVLDASVFPVGPFGVLVGDDTAAVELLQVASVAGNVLTLEAVSTQSHAAAESVQLVVSAAVTERLRGFALGHTHTGTTDGTVLAHTALTSIGTNTHAQLDTAAATSAAHIAATAAHGATGAVVGTTNAQVLTNKTLTTPTIGDFTNAQHNHSTAALGNTVDHTQLTTKGTNTHAQLDTAASTSASHIAATGTAVHGLGTMSTQAASSVAITGGSITGITDLAVADGGTGASTAGAARTNLGLVIGTNVQAWDTDLDTWATKTAPSGTVVGTTDSQVLSSKTLTTPTIGDFTNANHNHINAANGNTVDHTSLTQKGTNTHATIDLHISATAAHGGVAPTTFTPTFTQSGALTCTVGRALYQIVGKLAFLFVHVTFTSNGTAANALKMTNIPAAIAPTYVGSGGGLAAGNVTYGDLSTGTYVGNVQVMSATELQFRVHLGTSSIGVDPNIAVAGAGDFMSFTAMWEIA